MHSLAIGVKYVTMMDHSHDRRAEETGRSLGRVVRRLRFGAGRTVLFGEAPVIARVVLWAVGLAIVGALVFVTFWLALLVVFAWGAIKLLPHVSQSRDSDRPEWKWRQGLLGFGLYSQNGSRIDSHVPGPDA
jgi:Protein of unknown function (DUF3742)